MSTTKNMIALLVIILGLNTAYSQNFLNENFVYPVMPDLSGTGGWYNSGINSPNNISVISPSLEFPGHPGSFIGNKILFSNVTNGDILLRDFPTQNTGAIYLSCILFVDTLTDSATSGYNLAMDEEGSNTNIGARLMIQKVTQDSCRFGINKRNTTAYKNKVYHNNILIVAVIKYVFVSGSNNDSCMLYIFSSGIPLSEPPVPDVLITTGLDVNNFGQVVLSNSYSQSGLKNTLVQMDAIRVGTSWNTSVFASVKSISTQIPDNYKLDQNYPNPFNPTTKINFSILKKGLVKINVYDISGREVSDLVSEVLNPGAYSVNFDGQNLSSGTYFYRIQSGSFMDTKKMVLLK